MNNWFIDLDIIYTYIFLFQVGKCIFSFLKKSRTVTPNFRFRKRMYYVLEIFYIIEKQCVQTKNIHFIFQQKILCRKLCIVRNRTSILSTYQGIYFFTTTSSLFLIRKCKTLTNVHCYLGSIWKVENHVWNVRTTIVHNVVYY